MVFYPSNRWRLSRASEGPDASSTLILRLKQPNIIRSDRGSTESVLTGWKSDVNVVLFLGLGEEATHSLTATDINTAVMIWVCHNLSFSCKKSNLDHFYSASDHPQLHSIHIYPVFSILVYFIICFIPTNQEHTRPDSFNQLISVFKQLIGWL